MSLWNHNKKFHSNKNEIINNDNNIIINCEYCTKILKNKYLLTKHLTRCRLNPLNKEKLNNTNTNNINNEVKLKIILAEVEMEKTKFETEKLKLEQMNKELEILKLKQKSFKSTTNNIKNINNQLLNNSNNVTNNNFNIIALGKENILELLTTIEKKAIMRSKFSCLENIVDLVHCSNYNQFKNIVITNLKDDFAYKYDDNKNTFICVDKDELIYELVDERLENIREIYEELSETKKLDTRTKKLIQDFLEKMNDKTKYIEDNGISYKNFRAYKEHKVKILIYNNSDKISKDLAIILEEPLNINKNNIIDV
jgi:hypothetical protein